MKKILVVEDNPDNMDLIEAFLEDDYELIQAFDGESGFLKACECGMDLVLLDISLPNMDGTEVVKKIRETESIKNIPVVALTAHAMLGDRDKFIKCGFDEYMSKPIVDEDDLINLIEELLDRSNK
jgi:CheY-like chemotaxis protein